MIDELIDKILNGKTLDYLKTKAFEVSKTHDYATALAWTVANKNNNNDLGKVGEHLANQTFGWKRVRGETDSKLGEMSIEIKTSAPPQGKYRIGQIKTNYDLQQSLFCQFFHLQSKDLQFYWIDTIEEFLEEFDQWIGNDQGKDGTNVGIRAMPHNGPCWKHLQKWRIEYDKIPRRLEKAS